MEGVEISLKNLHAPQTIVCKRKLVPRICTELEPEVDINSEKERIFHVVMRVVIRGYFLSFSIDLGFYIKPRTTIHVLIAGNIFLQFISRKLDWKQFFRHNPY